MRTLVQLLPGGERAQELESRGAGCPALVQLVPLSCLLNPSRQVHSTWAEKSETRGGRASPSLLPSLLDGRPFWGTGELIRQMRAGCPLTPDR